MLRLASLAVALGGSGILFGQTPDSIDHSPSHHLDGVVISDTRQAEPILETPQSVTVIDQDQIQASGAENLGELLSREVGIHIDGTQQAPGAIQRLSMRGAASYMTQILVDGIRISDPSSPDNAPDLSELGLDNIDRIEIIHGAHSTVSGSSAIGGSVNIITDGSPIEKWVLTGQVSGAYFGDEAYHNSNVVKAAYRMDNGLYVNAFGQFQVADGLDATVDTFSNPNAFRTQDADDFKQNRFGGKVGFDKNEWKTYVAFSRTDQDRGIDDGAYNDDENRRLSFQRNLLTYGAYYQGRKDIDFQFRGGWTTMQRSDIDDSSVINPAGQKDGTFVSSDFEGQQFNNEALLLTRNKWLHLTLGTGFEREEMATSLLSIHPVFGTFTSDLDSLGANTFFGFAHAAVNFSELAAKLDGLKLNLGGRFSNHEGFGSALTWEVAPSFLHKQTLYYVNVSSGFNAPSLYRLYHPTLGNPDLRPEQSLGIEVGMKQQVSRDISFTAAYYNVRIRDIVDYIYRWNGNTEIESLTFADYLGDGYINLSEHRSEGIEFGLQAGPVEGFTLRANATLQQTNLTIAPDEVRSHSDHIQLFESGIFIEEVQEVTDLARRPEALLNVALGYQVKSKLWLEAGTRTVGPRRDVSFNPTLGPFGSLDRSPLGDYTLVHFKAKWQATDALDIVVRFDNLLNENYEEILGFRTRGRHGSLQIRYRLKAKTEE